MRFKTMALLCGLVVITGCRGSRHRSSAYGPPPASATAEYGVPTDATAAAPTPDALAYQSVDMPPEKCFVDRHPLFSAPRNYYRDSSSNPVMKVLAGTFVGVPVGVVRETKQIVYGQ